MSPNIVTRARRSHRLARITAILTALAMACGLGALTTTPAVAAPITLNANWLDYYFNNKAIGGDESGDAPNLESGRGFHRTNLIAGAAEVTHAGGVKFDAESRHPNDAEVTYWMSGNATGPFGDNVEMLGQDIDTSRALGSAAAQPATKIAFVWTAHNAGNIPSGTAMTLRYSDASTQTLTLSVPDWCSDGNSTNTMIATRQARYGDTAKCTLFISNVITLAAGQTLDTISLPDEARIHLFAIASDADTSNALYTNEATVLLDGDISVGAPLPTPTVTWASGQPQALDEYWQIGSRLVSPDSLTTPVVPVSWANQEVSYLVVAHNLGYAAAVTSSDPVTTTPAALSVLTPPTVTGLARAGDALVVNVGQYTIDDQTPAEVATQIEWLANGQVIEGADSEIFTPTAAEVGETITARITVTKYGYQTLTATTEPTAAVLAADQSPYPDDNTGPETPQPLVAIHKAASVSTKAAVGNTIKVSSGSYEPAAATISYQWYANARAIAGATKASYQPTVRDNGTVLSVRITVRATGRQAVEQLLTVGLVQAGTISAAKPKLTVKKKQVKKKKVKVGQVLRVQGAKAKAATSTVTTKYRWFANGKKIAGKKGAKARLKVTKKFVGKKIHVTVTYRAAGYAKAAISSAKTAKVVR